jgi:virulence-associated protein VagC
MKLNKQRDKAKIFYAGRSQAVQLPPGYRFTGAEVFIRPDHETGEVILSHIPKHSWSRFFALVDHIPMPNDFLSDRDHEPANEKRLC